MAVVPSVQSPLYTAPDICILSDETHRMILEAIQDVCHHGFGRVEVTIQEGNVTVIHATKTIRPQRH